MPISMTSASSLSVPSRILTNVENEQSDYYETKGEAERDRLKNWAYMYMSARTCERKSELKLGDDAMLN